MTPARPRARRATALRAALLGLLFLLVLAAPIARPAAAADSAVIVQYHRFGEGEYPSTNVTLEQFEAQIAQLKAGGYAVLPVRHIIAALKSGTPLPDRTVGITIDDAYRSVYTEAWPRLNVASFPFTLFVTTNSIDRGSSDMMSWDQLRELATAGVTIANHGASHEPLWKLDPEAARADVAKGAARLDAELGITPKLFAYPYGEYDLRLEEIVREMGYDAAFGQQSGAIFPGADFFALPRFALNETYGDPDRFALVIDTLPLPVRDVTPADSVLRSNNPPAFGFTVDPSLEHIDRIACFASHLGRVNHETLGGNRIEVRFDRPFPPGRTRINCTLPGPDGRWRWFGVQYVVP